MPLRCLTTSSTHLGCNSSLAVVVSNEQLSHRAAPLAASTAHRHRGSACMPSLSEDCDKPRARSRKPVAATAFPFSFTFPNSSQRTASMARERNDVDINLDRPASDFAPEPLDGVRVAFAGEIVCVTAERLKDETDAELSCRLTEAATKADETDDYEGFVGWEEEWNVTTSCRDYTEQVREEGGGDLLYGVALRAVVYAAFNLAYGSLAADITQPNKYAATIYNALWPVLRGPAGEEGATVQMNTSKTLMEIRTRGLSSWSPASEATFDVGMFVTSPTHGALIWAFAED
eukprot:PLAT6425.1.p1 GENE.PLAT6425.1~~PLAT6425.1.p1  ORF type:complete len:314 (+),score=22.10 PLAT6425.1:78-944(+)